MQTCGRTALVGVAGVVLRRIFFSKIKSPDYCLHSVLPEEKTLHYALRPREHQFQLPTCV